jgi:hypothetical protein
MGDIATFTLNSPAALTAYFGLTASYLMNGQRDVNGEIQVTYRNGAGNTQVYHDFLGGGGYQYVYGFACGAFVISTDIGGSNAYLTSVAC